MFRRRGRPGGRNPAPEQIYNELRARALRAVEQHVLPPPPPEHPSVSGVVIDIPGDAAFATLVAMTDGATSLYTSSGGGVIGAGEYAHVAARTHELLKEVQTHFAQTVAPDPS